MAVKSGLSEKFHANTPIAIFPTVLLAVGLFVGFNAGLYQSRSEVVAAKQELAENRQAMKSLEDVDAALKLADRMLKEKTERLMEIADRLLKSRGCPEVQP